MADLGGSQQTRSRRGTLLFAFAFLGVTAIVLVVAILARQLFLYREPDIVPILAGSDLDQIPALMRGNVKSATTSVVYKETVKPLHPRLCEMPEGYFDILDTGDEHTVGYTRRNGYVRPYLSRRGFLDDRDMRIAMAAWNYFVLYTQEATGLVNAVGNYQSTTLWDTASYISGMVSAYELCLIEKPEFDQRMIILLTTLRDLNLFRGELPNKVYNTKTGEKVDYANKPGEIGYSALDIGRLMIWLRIVKNRYSYFGNSIDSILLKWDFSNVIDSEGLLYGAHIDEETDKTVYVQEGRLGYEEYAAKGFALWGFHTVLAHRAEPFLTAEIFGVAVPYDGRDPRIFHSQNYVVTESYLLDGIELGFDLPHDDSSPEIVHSDGWRAEFADRIYRVQEERWRQTGFMTARSEHNVKGAPYFTYDTIFSDGYAWNTVTPRGDYVPDHAAVSAKAALGLWALWETEYTEALYEAIADLYDPEIAMYEGVYERGQGRVAIFTANNNGIILAAMLHKVQGTILTPYTGETEVWYTAFRDQNIRQLRKYPDPPSEADWLLALRHRSYNEDTFQ